MPRSPGACRSHLAEAKKLPLIPRNVHIRRPALIEPVHAPRNNLPLCVEGDLNDPASRRPLGPGF